MRRYRGLMADSGRWERFPLRAGDVVISTPSKSGTTWMQHIVGMLLLDTTDFGMPLSRVSPWLDLLTHREDEVFALLAAQTHRRFVKTHTPLDGVPARPDVTYVTVARHPLDVALSHLDHRRNSRPDRAAALREAATGAPDPSVGQPPGFRPPPGSGDPREHLLWFVDSDNPSRGSGSHGLSDLCHQVVTAWQRRRLPNVHLFHYQDLWDDLPGEMGRVAAAIGVRVEGHDRGGTADPRDAMPAGRFAELVDAARFDAVRSRAARTAPEAETGILRDPAAFFHHGGRRDWAALLTPAEVARFHDRLQLLAGDAADWLLTGRRARDPDLSRRYSSAERTRPPGGLGLHRRNT